MRIIAGKAKGRRLVVPSGTQTRPTPDRVKESLFSILATRPLDACVLDAFAGTGALGLEALSRGAAHTTFIEKDRAALDALRRNIDATRMTNVEVIAAGAERAILTLGEKKRRFDLVFLDPPYSLNLLEPTFEALVGQGVLLSTALVVCEHHRKSAPPAGPTGWIRVDRRDFGDVSLSFYERDAA